MKPLTFSEAKTRLWNFMSASHEWNMSSPSLKVPHATYRYPKGGSFIRIWFKSQSLYLGSSDSPLGAARSLHIDVREVAKTDEGIINFLKWAEDKY